MKYRIFLFLFLASSCVFSQKKFSEEISLITENDLYVSTQKDRYYTSGIFLSYSYLIKPKNEFLEKRIIKWGLNHEMYTPIRATVENKTDHDRPFAGYLYGSFAISTSYKNNTILNTSMQLGVIGSASFAEELQNFVHDIYGFKRAIGWKYQIKNAIGLNVSAAYYKPLISETTDFFDINWISSANLGTIYTNITTGFYSRIGFKPLQKIINSIAFNAQLNDKHTKFNNENESFIYLKPTVRYAAYDATLQGSFLNTSSTITKELIPIVFDLELGIRFTANHFNFGYGIHFNTNKSEGLRAKDSNRYGSIVINYMLY